METSTGCRFIETDLITTIMKKGEVFVIRKEKLRI